MVGRKSRFLPDRLEMNGDETNGKSKFDGNDNGWKSQTVFGNKTLCACINQTGGKSNPPGEQRKSNERRRLVKIYKLFDRFEMPTTKRNTFVGRIQDMGEKMNAKEEKILGLKKIIYDGRVVGSDRQKL